MSSFLLDRPVQYLKGVGPRRAEQLDKLGVRSARDMALHIPRRYEDASTVAPISSLEVGMDATVIGEVVSKGVLPTRKGLRIFQAVVRDETGLIECSWPGQPFLDRSIRKGDRLLVTGPVRFFHGRQLQPREYVVLDRSETPDGGRVLPIYPATEGLSQRIIRSILEANLDRLLPLFQEQEPFPPDHLKRVGIPPLRPALETLHRPPSIREAELARKRLVYGELFFLQLLHARAHHLSTRDREGITFSRSNELIRPFHEGLSFELTGAQKRAVREIFRDMTSSRRMNRLLQGDVGSGKTVVAVLAMLLAAESGYQAALMAPTELLAEQHYRTVTSMLESLDLEPTLLLGRQSGTERSAARKAVAGGAPLVIGTHALIQESVRFRRLGLVVVDEQHRFGVRQRMALTEGAGATDPDTLVMSATPIPRSLALTLYGDLDVSVLDERPPGRKPVRTAIRDPKSAAKVWQFIREHVESGRQAYVVYPLIQESEKVDLKAATAEYETLSTEVFPDLEVGLMHGRLSSDEKDAVMASFVSGATHVLVSTTVIEVGIDVPNATVMVVEHAERFGLSQLHQLRGRIGRGGDESFCVLMAGGGPESRERLRILADTDDGFEIARADLRLRGMGDLFGARQHGLPEFRYFDPERDEALLLTARNEAWRVVEKDPELRRAEHRAFRDELVTRYGDRARMYEVG